MVVCEMASEEKEKERQRKEGEQMQGASGTSSMGNQLRKRASK